MKDFHDIFNAIGGGGPAPRPAHVSFDVLWAGHGEHRRVRDETFQFTGEYIGGAATITFAATNDRDEVIYTAMPEGQYNPGPEQGGAGSPAVGHERNGRFFA